MAQSQESQESTEMDMVPGPEVVRTLSFVDQEALVGAARVGNPTVGQGATCGAEGQSAGPQSSPRKRNQLNYNSIKKNTGANAPWGHSWNLKKGTSPEGKGR